MVYSNRNGNVKIDASFFRALRVIEKENSFIGG